MTDFHVIIPARYASQRLPGKVLLDIAGKTMIQHVYERALSSDARTVTVATDDDRIAKTVQSFGGAFCMTSTQHASGTDRIAEAVDHLGLDNNDIVVNLQGDEPQMPGELIKRVAVSLAEHAKAAVATACEPINSEDEYNNPSVVKVVCDKQDFALYFSRAAIPVLCENSGAAGICSPKVYRHIGIYAYRAAYLKEFANLEASPLELSERLEQLRALWYGHRIYVCEALESSGISVDTKDDLERIRRIFN